MAKGADPAPPPKGGLTGWLVMALLALLAVAAGVSLPLYFFHESPRKAAQPALSKRPALIQFGEVIVNLGEERLTRYLRAKILLVVDESHEKVVNDLLQRQKPFLKSWLITYLSDQSMQEVSGAAGVNRVRREVRDQFNALLFPDGSEKVQDILFDEFVVQ